MVEGDHQVVVTLILSTGTDDPVVSCYGNDSEVVL